jgi:hypothetical protein
MNIALTPIVDAYDQCKRIRTPEECRQIAASGAAKSAQGYLVSYDACVKLLGRDRCRQMLSSERSAPVAIALVSFAAGFLVGRILK